MADLVRDELESRAALMRLLAERLSTQILLLADAVSSSVLSGGKLLLAGNGGSAATAQHIAAEFVGRFQLDRGPIAALALCADTATLTALSNDFGFQSVFARQVQAYAGRNDVLLLMTTSGQSRNLLAAAEAAHVVGCRMAALTGRHGGPLADLVDLWLATPADQPSLVQEAHLAIGHVLCGVVEAQLFAAKALGASLS